MRHPARRLSRTSAFLLGILFMFGIRGGSAVASDTPEIPCLAPTAPAEPLASQAPPTPAPVPPLLRISEVLPDPVGRDADGEFIEVENISDEDVDASGWRIADAKGKTYVIPETRVAAHGSRTFVYAETKIALVNAVASYVLQDANGVTVDVASYPSPVPEGKSYARFDGGWRWTETPTPGAANVFHETVDAPPPTPELAEPTSLPPAPSPMPTPAAPEPVVSPPLPEPIAVVISEILPNPDGDDATEWIELRNDGAGDAALAGWMLDDADGGSTPYAFSAERVPAGGFLIVPRATSRLALNNDADDVRLIAPDASVRQSVRYEYAPSGKSFAYDGEQWRWTTPTPGDGNRFDDVLPEVVVSASKNVQPPSDEEAVIDATIEDAVSLEDDTTVLLSGIVTLPPGIIGKTILAIRDADGAHGAFVRIRGKTAVTPLMPGDTVMLRGRVRRDGGSLLAVNAKDVKKTGHGALGAIPQRDATSVTEDDVGLTVSVTGTVTAKGAGWVKLGAEGDGAEIRGAFMKGLAIGATAVGDQATMTGVVRLRSGKPEIVVFEKGSFIAQKTPHQDAKTGATPDTSITNENRETIVLAAKGMSRQSIIWSVVAIISVGGSIAGYAFWRRRRFA